jgi:hypothetical protein
VKDSLWIRSTRLTQDGQQDVDPEVNRTSTLQEDTNRRDEDGEKDLDDIAAGERHDEGCSGKGYGCMLVLEA